MDILKLELRVQISVSILLIPIYMIPQELYHTNRISQITGNPKPIVNPPCPSGMSVFSVDIVTDDYPGETCELDK